MAELERDWSLLDAQIAHEYLEELDYQEREAMKRAQREVEQRRRT